MKKKAILILALIMIMSVFAGCGSDSSGADTVIKGTIYTADENDTVAEAAAIKDGKFVYVGDETGLDEYLGEDTEIIETGDGMVMPSFMESHAHGHEGGVAGLFEVNLYEDDTVAKYQATIKQFIEDHPDREFIKGAGWVNGFFPDNAPTAAMLDEVNDEIPMAFVSADHHSYWVNTKAMELMGVDKNTKDIPGGVIVRDSEGNPTGCFRENAQELVTKVIPEYSVDEFKEGILAYQNEIKDFGITAYFEPMINIGGGTNLLDAYNQLDDEGKLVVRVFGGYQVEDVDGYMDELDKVQTLKDESEGGDFQVTSIKLFMDGVVEGHTAYLLEDYADESGDRGEPLWDQDHLNKFAAKADKMGIQLHAHAIGDAAVRMMVDAYDYANKENGESTMRHAITHLQLASKDDIKRMGELKVVAAANPYWFFKEAGYFNEVEVPYLGEERANSEYPMKSFFDSGVITTNASDYPVTVVTKPLEAIQTGVTRCDGRTGDKSTLLGPDQRVDVLQMMKTATYNGAYAYFGEDTFGSIAEGLSADYIVLGQNIMEIDPFDIAATPLLKTVFKGKTLFEGESEEK